MATATTYGNISQRTGTYAEVKMLDTAAQVSVLNLFGQTKPLPKNKADNAKYRRPKLLAPATTALTEGVTPTAKALQYEDVAVQMQQFGDLIEISDRVEDMNEDPVLNDSVDVLAVQYADTMEAVCYGVLKAGTSVFYTNGSARNAVNTVISLNKIRAVSRFLQANRARRITKMLDGSANYNTKPVEAGYIAFCHTDCEADLRNLTDFTPVAEYGSRKVLSPHELGTVENIRFITSPMLGSFIDAGGLKGTMKSTGGANADVYPMLFIGEDAYGHVPLKGKGAVTPRVINPDTVDKSDPLGQRGYVSWKAYYNAVILNQLWMARIEVAVTDL